MRVLFLNELLTPGTGGGAEAHIATLWRGLEELGHGVTIAGPLWQDALEWADVVHVHNFIHAFGFEALDAAERAGKRVIVSLHDYWPFCPSRMAIRGFKNCLGHGCQYECHAPRPEYIERLKRYACVTFCTRAGEIFAAHGLPVRVIPHGINLDFWKPHGRCLPSGAVRVAVVTAWGGDGAPGVWKGIPFAREAEARLGARAEFRYILGGYPREDVRALYRWADVALVPSIYEETFCLVAAEAAACGTPVVGFAVGGLLDLATIAVQEGDVDALAVAILGASGMPPRPVRSYREMAADYVRLYQESAA